MTEATQESQENAQPIFSIEKIYVKDLSLEIPHAPAVFLERDVPQIEVELSTHSANIEVDMYEVTITNTVTAKLGEKVIFLIEAKQAGIFRLANLAEQDMERVLAVMCPNILFPYLHELISNTAVRAGFAPVLLNPVNFDILYQQNKMEQAQAAATSQ